MKRYLFVSRSHRGHINPMIGVAQWLLRGGHEIVWATAPIDSAADEQIERIGARPVHPRGGGVAGARPPEADLARLFRDEPHTAVARISELHTARPRRDLAPMAELIREVKPHVVVQDGVLYEGAIGAHLAGIPFVNTCTNFRIAAPPDVHYQLTEVAAAIADARRALFEEHGLACEFRELECVSPTLNVVFSTAAFLPTEHLPPHTHLVGPSLPIGTRGDEPAAEDLAVAPGSVYLSLGTVLHWQPALVTAAARAAHELGAPMIMAVGGLADDAEFRRSLPATAQVHRYVPQLAVLQRVRAFVTHGGANSVTEGLLHGLPLVIVPLGLEQPLQRWFVERAGVGRGVAPAEADVAACRAALGALLPDDSPYRARAREVGRSFAAADGAQRAAELIAAL
jgi:zeaxanthin glucosyltransferase